MSKHSWPCRKHEKKNLCCLQKHSRFSYPFRTCSLAYKRKFFKDVLMYTQIELNALILFLTVENCGSNPGCFRITTVEYTLGCNISWNNQKYFTIIINMRRFHIRTTQINCRENDLLFLTRILHTKFPHFNRTLKRFSKVKNKIQALRSFWGYCIIYYIHHWNL